MALNQNLNQCWLSCWSNQNIFLFDSIPYSLFLFQVNYRAEGSNIEQITEELAQETNNYDILQLHENTYYSICINVISNVTETGEMPCIRATTSVDSLSVALGSTFGAFLALGIVVLLVFVAKWQHTRKLKKHLRHVTPTGDTYDSMAQHEGDLEMSDVSLQVNDGTATNDQISSKSSQLSEGTSTRLKEGYYTDGEQYANGMLEGAAFDSLEASDEYEDADEMSDEEMSPVGMDMLARTLPDDTPTPPAIDPPPISNKKRGGNRDSYSSGSTPAHTPTPTSQSIHTDSSSNSDGNSRPDYGGARPKEYSTSMDSRNSYPNSTLVELSGGNPVPLQPDTNCRWWPED